MLKKNRPDSRSYQDLGEYYTVNLNANAEEDKHIDLEEWAREEGLLADHESLESE